MATNKSKRGDDLTPLEGGGGGGGAGVRDTKWSGLPSFRSNASIVDDFKKLTAPATKAKGAAKRSVELAADRAVSRMVARGVGTGAAVAGAKALTGKEAAAAKDKDTDDYEDMGGDVNVDYSNPTGVSGKGMKKGGSVSSASKRADGCAVKGKTKGRMI